MVLSITLLFGACKSINNAPVITDLKAEPSQIDKNITTTLQCTAVDVDGDILTYKWEARKGTIVGYGPIVKWIAPNDDGVYQIVVSVLDGKDRQISSGGKSTENAKGMNR
jgi:hypothetical protein